MSKYKLVVEEDFTIPNSDFVLEPNDVISIESNGPEKVSTFENDFSGNLFTNLVIEINELGPMSAANSFVVLIQMSLERAVEKGMIDPSDFDIFLNTLEKQV